MKQLLRTPRYLLIGLAVMATVGLVAGAGLYLHIGLLTNFPASPTAIATLLLLVMFALMAGVAAAAVYRHHHEVKRVVAAAELLAKGDLADWEPVPYGQDLNQLAQAFQLLQRRLRETTVSRNYLDRVLSSMQDALILVGHDGNIRRVNKAASELLDSRQSELTGRPVTEILVERERAAFPSAGQAQTRGESVFVSRNGEEIPVAYSWSPIEAVDADLSGAIIAARDITERKLADRRIRYLARIDALTKVPNRMQFQHLLQRSLARSRRNRARIALLYIDIDRFKDINDTFGHMAGDAALETLTSRVTKLLPDRAFMGRLAGDEFGVVVYPHGPVDRSNVELNRLARRILREVAEVLIVQGHELYITVSIGIAGFPSDADNVLDLIRNADAALYEAKATGGNRIEFYRPEMNAAAVERLMLKSKLRRSYELDQLLLNYQPKVDVRTGKIAGAEALVRWELSDHGLVLPSQFIPLAEETNLILEIGEWVLNRVCEDYAHWRARGSEPGRISVNLSLKQLAQPNFPRRINRIFRRHGIQPDCLELELTETTLMENPEHTIRVLRELHRMGLRLAIDDFGTGYSSLSALQRFPIATLKIDQSFVSDAASDPDDATMIATMVDMAHRMNMDVVAEGVESEEQLGLLRRLHCDFVQGMLFGEPMSAEAYQALVNAQRDGTDSYRALFA
ncbi:MAG: EAL domain-containing protein [Gammaproteobacteria bacterium]|nr:EAL domain-containing protein [Gammaproteobacteria bacterium]